MIKEFVSYDQAISLKELGFNESCIAIYSNANPKTGLYNSKKYKLKLIKQYSQKDKGVKSPTYQQAFRFFREKCNFFCEIKIDRTTEPKFCFIIFKYEHFGNYEKAESEEWYLYRTYEEAESACLDKLIEINKNK